jgi:AAA+ ATPase superfamily predicted ATPase
MDEIIGRQAEQEVLTEILQSKSAEFVVVYGRRRIGKTFLIRTFFKQKKCVFFHITGIQDGHMPDQIFEFTRILETTFYGPGIHLQEPKSWTKAFALLTNTIKKENPKGTTVLFFDELPWLASQKSGFTKALDYYWNRFWVDMPNIKLIVCGSAAAWIIDNILNHKGGLHNRVTKRVVLDAFSLKEVKDYMHSKKINYTDQQILELYMILGGVPYYLSLITKKLSVSQNIDKLMFNQKGELLNEFDVLYRSLFNNPEKYEEIIRVIASKREGIERKDSLNQLKLSTEGGSFNKRLKELETSGFIINFKPYGFKKKSNYKIIDEFTLFYLDWVEPQLSTIKSIRSANNYWLEKCKTAGWHSWAGYAFEAVCLKHIEQIRQTLKVNASAEIGNWRYIPKKSEKEQGGQIDLLFDRSDKVVTICEIRCSQTPYRLNKQEFQSLNSKCEVFLKKTGINKQIHLALITPMGVEKSIYSEELVGVVTLKDLMEG